MSQENVEIVRRYYAAWNAGGLDAARAFWSDDFEWHDAPEMPDSSVYRGVEAAAAHSRSPHPLGGPCEGMGRNSIVSPPSSLMPALG